MKRYKFTYCNVFFDVLYSFHNFALNHLVNKKSLPYSPYIKMTKVLNKIPIKFI